MPNLDKIQSESISLTNDLSAPAQPQIMKKVWQKPTVEILSDGDINGGTIPSGVEGAKTEVASAFSYHS